MIDSLRLQNFRSYKDESFEFEPGVNIVIGPNASGKTNLLEAVLVLASGRSFRAKDNDLVSFDRTWARLDGFFGSSNRSVKFISSGEKAQKSFVLENKEYKRLSLERTIPTVLFEPNHLQLISRGPEFRRLYFDDILERSKPGFKNLNASYRRALAQRNALLKQPPQQAKKQLFAWNIRLSELGAQIAIARQDLINEVNKSISGSYSKIAGHRSKVELHYETPFVISNYSSKLLSKLEANDPLDFQRGFTAYGPHREDVMLYINKKPGSTSASRGEVRSLLIALKIFELGLLKKTRGTKPIFLLDDVFSELDGARRSHLVEYLKDYQSIITTTDADAVIQHFSNQHKVIGL
ncbi:MAG TPA: DNA replication and repair protein RecF [Candidatus Saccharimonadales bacterium]|nr:DNA replication and repair protein RecF [Candidatus Saccharimonadales bacterium]